MSRRLRASPEVPRTLREGFALLREEMGVPGAFPPEVLAAAEEAARRPPVPDGRADLRDVPFVTVDPPGSMDLDQALRIDRDGDGWTVRYAIADLRDLVPRGGPVEAEAWRRGETIYLPDGRATLYPPVLSEGAASLLPDGDRAAVVFEVPVAADGAPGPLTARRALVRSRARLAYPEAGGDVIPNLREAGTALSAAAARRGAVSVDLPGQAVVPADTPAGFALSLETRLPQEEWNAQVSLLVNVACARLMLAAGVGVFRVLDDPDPVRAAGLRAAAVALGFAVPEPVPDGALSGLAGVGAGAPAGVHLRRAVRRASGGAGYRALPGDGPPPFHAAVAAPYAHATAPLRRLADRYVIDLVVALAAGERPGPAGTGVLAGLPEVMNRADALADRVEGAAIDLVEATLLAPQVGREFDAVVTGATDRGARVQLRDPAVRGVLPGLPAPPPGSVVRVALADADPAARRITLRRA